MKKKKWVIIAIVGVVLYILWEKSKGDKAEDMSSRFVVGGGSFNGSGASFYVK